MKNFLVAFLIFLVWALFALWLFSWLVPSSSLISENVTPTSEIEKIKDLNKSDSTLIEEEKNTDGEISEDTLARIKNIAHVVTGIKALNEDNDIIFAFDEGISFKKNHNTILSNPSIVDYKYKVNSYLIEHPDQEVHINSLYSADENIKNPNLGVQRGMLIKKILMNTGVPAEKIVVKSIIKNLKFDNDSIYKNAIDFQFAKLNKDRIANQVEEVTVMDVPDSMLFYPNYSYEGLLADKKLKELATKINQITTQNPYLKVIIVGYTDNLNDANENYRMGLVYAQEIKAYLVKKGFVKEDRISAISNGEMYPIYSNSTEEGRRLNKRIEIKFK